MFPSHRTRKSATRSLLVTMTACAAIGADVPPRSQSGQTLLIPAAHLDLGDIYHITPGEDAQLVCTSDAQLQRVVAVCRRVVGYVVSPFDLEEGQSPIVAGVCRIPVASIDTGSKEFNDLLRGEKMLDAGKHPEITFEITATRGAKLTSAEGQPRAWSLTLLGKLDIKGAVKELEIPARVALLPFTFQTMMRYPGELLTLRCSLELTSADLGLQPLGRQWTGRIADKFTVDVFLFGNTVRPDKSLDPAVKNDEMVKQLHFLTLLRDLKKTKDGYKLGRRLLREFGANAAALDRLAMAVLEERDIEYRDFNFAAAASNRANQLTDHKDASMLSHMARIHYQRGNLSEAVKWQSKAVENLAGISPPQAAGFRATLKRYQEQADAAGP